MLESFLSVSAGKTEVGSLGHGAWLHVRAYSRGSGPGSRQNRDRVRVQGNFKSPSLVTYFQHPGWPTYLNFIAPKIARPKHEHMEDSSHSNNSKPNFNVLPI